MCFTHAIFHIFSFLFSHSQITHITCSGLFELRLKSFRNDKGVNSIDQCCSERQMVSGGSCLGSCKTRFRVCLKQYQAEIDTTSSCTFGAAATAILGDNSFNFTNLYASSQKNQPQKGSSINPIRFPFEFTWPVSKIFFFIPFFVCFLSSSKKYSEVIAFFQRVAKEFLNLHHITHMSQCKFKYFLYVFKFHWI